jgi:hypothetical protein
MECRNVRYGTGIIYLQHIYQTTVQEEDEVRSYEE